MPAMASQLERRPYAIEVEHLNKTFGSKSGRSLRSTTSISTFARTSSSRLSGLRKSTLLKHFCRADRNDVRRRETSCAERRLPATSAFVPVTCSLPVANRSGVRPAADRRSQVAAP